MPSWTNRPRTYPLLAAILFLTLAGCGDDDSPTSPDPTGTVIVDVEPGTLDADWIVTGPGDYSENGTGDQTLSDLDPGEYSITWIAVDGYITPTSPAQTLEADETITFAGTYAVDPDPSGAYVTIPSGTFIMGSPEDESGRESGEVRHSVTLTRSFLMLPAEVTNRQFADLAQWALDQGYCTATGSNVRDALDGSTMELLKLDVALCEISFNDGTFTVDAGKDDHPVLCVTWFGAAAYCDWLSLQASLPRAYDHATWQCNGHAPYTAAGYRLPTESEWEYACRANSQTPFNTGGCLDAGTDANYNGGFPYPGCAAGAYEGASVAVGGFAANDWGLHDMHGNLAEWCNDIYGAYDGDATDPAGPASGFNRVIRGGSWDSMAQQCRSAYRVSRTMVSSYGDVGFRPVRSLD